MTADEDPPAPDDTKRGRSSPRDWLVEGYAEGEATYLGGVSGDGNETRTAVIYDDREEVVFEADVDEDEQRYVPREGTERELGPSETLGDVLEDLGDRLDWASLSEFARAHLEEDDREQAASEPETVSFTRSNVLADAEHDLEFTGAYTYRKADGRIFDVERTFEVTLDDPEDPGEATADVTERVLRAEEPDEHRRAGDTELLEERGTTFEIDLGSVEGGRQVEPVIEGRCQQWHEESTPDPPV